MLPQAPMDAELLLFFPWRALWCSSLAEPVSSSGDVEELTVWHSHLLLPPAATDGCSAPHAGHRQPLQPECRLVVEATGKTLFFLVSLKVTCTPRCECD